ncbi:MAG: hypothetical protein AMXMBFR20_07470 [Planctomycetia bacterium]
MQAMHAADFAGECLKCGLKLRDREDGAAEDVHSRVHGQADEADTDIGKAVRTRGKDNDSDLKLAQGREALAEALAIACRFRLFRFACVDPDGDIETGKRPTGGNLSRKFDQSGSAKFARRRQPARDNLRRRPITQNGDPVYRTPQQTVR